MNQRILILISLLMVLPAAFLMVYQFTNDPLQGRRQLLAEELQRIPHNVEFPAPADWPFETWNDNILSKSALFSALVPMPEPPPPPPPEPPKPPNLCEKLKGVTPTRQQIGKKKIKMITPESPKGAFMSPGDSVAGCKLADFDKQGATFTFFWAEGGKQMSCKIDLSGSCQPL